MSCFFSFLSSAVNIPARTQQCFFFFFLFTFLPWVSSFISFFFLLCFFLPALYLDLFISFIPIQCLFSFVLLS